MFDFYILLFAPMIFDIHIVFVKYPLDGNIV